MNRKYLLFAAVLLVALLIGGCVTKSSIGALPAFSQKEEAGTLYVHFIDVGQGNAILLRLPDVRMMLIDSGSRAAEDKLLAYLKKVKVSKLDFLIATHPHEDHIGNMDAVINKFAVVDFYIPKVTTTTRTFKDMMQAANNKKLKVKTATAGVVLIDEPAIGLKVEMLAPNSKEYEDLNNYSAVVKVTYKNKAVLITGDAEKVSEKEMLARGYNLKANILQIGHHGSTSSTTKAFLQAVSPQYAYICVGKDNDYGHPHKETLKKLADAGITVYRSDVNGSVVAVVTPDRIEFFAN